MSAAMAWIALVQIAHSDTASPNPKVHFRMNQRIAMKFFDLIPTLRF